MILVKLKGAVLSEKLKTQPQQMIKKIKLSTERPTGVNKT